MKRTSAYFLAAAMLMALASARPANAQIFVTTYFVNTTSDMVVADACANVAPGCSLRGAIEAANGNPGEDHIEFNLSMSDRAN